MNVENIIYYMKINISSSYIHLLNNNNKGSRSNVNKHELVNCESSIILLKKIKKEPFSIKFKVILPPRCLFIICFIVNNLYYCCYAKTSSSAFQKRHSKVYGNPIAPSFYSILLGPNQGDLF